eukprot:COSAG03_NODE_29657_length_180_cov_11.197531_1_plen_29_part_10
MGGKAARETFQELASDDSEDENPFIPLSP